MSSRTAGVGESQHGGMKELCDDVAETEIGRTEIVSPLADAMRLVDDEERYAQHAQNGDEGLVLELLRRDENDLDLAARNARDRCRLLILRKR
jgi:hypothetical protein